jgi:hypothetical protein
MNAEEARRHLLAQHDQLRERILMCTRVAKLFRVGLASTRDLDLSIDILREAFTAHNDSETSLIRTLLHGPASWGSLLIDRMLEEHQAEHTAFLALMSGTADEIAGCIEELAEELDAHMAAEERTFLAPVTLRDDVIRTRTREEPDE